MHRSLSRLAFTIALCGCAPSHRMVHDGNVYFEACYGADFSPKVTQEQREACWNAWLAHYARHQPAHRIDYAMRRVESLQAGELSPGLPDLSGPTQQPPLDVKGSGAEVTMTGPRAGAEVQTNLAQAETVTPGCGATCDLQLKTCTADCPDSAESCPKQCEREKAICLGGCY